MPVNIEIKARVSQPLRLQAMVEALSAVPETAWQQEETFFHAPRGRLKLRTLSPTGDSRQRSHRHGLH